MSGAGAAEQRAGCDQNVCPFQQRLTEVLSAEAGFLNAGEKVEGALGPHQTEVGDLIHPVRRVENAVPVGQNVFLTNGLPNRQRLYGGPLGDGGGRIDQGVVDVAHDLQYLRLRDGYAHPPAGHEKILGKAVQGDDPVSEPRDRADRDEVPLIEIGGIDLIRRDQQIMLLRHPAQQFQRGAVIAHAGGVAGIVEHNELGARSDGRTEAGFVNGPALACVGGDLHAYAPGQFRLCAVGGEVGGKDDDLVTGVQNGQHHQRHSHAAGSGDQNVIRGEGLLEIHLPRVTDGADQLRVTLWISIVGVPGLGFPKGGVDNGVIGDKVCVTDAEINDIRIPGQRVGVQTQSGVGILKSLGDI